jgi:hypothetical protein
MISKKQGVAYFVLAVSLVILSLFFLNITKADNIVNGNYKNITVHTSVNITNAKPEVLSVVVYQELNYSQRNITLLGGQLRNITCNTTIRDWNGYNDVVNVNATLFDTTSTSNSTDNNNTHYTNTNCTNSGNGANYTAGYTCTFPVYYYANNGTWTCNVSVIDTYKKTGTNVNNTYIYSLFALNVTDSIDYGAVAVEDFSSERSANITNFGNMAINISLEGYGATRGDGLAMNCTVNGNITIDNERYALTSGAWGTKTGLTGATDLVPGLTMPKQTISATRIINATYWQY